MSLKILLLQRMAGAALLVVVLFLSGCGTASMPLPAPSSAPAAETPIPSSTFTVMAVPPTVTSTPTTAPTATFTPALTVAPILTWTAAPSAEPGGRGAARLVGCGKTQGSVESQEIQGGEYGMIPVRIYLPPCYTLKPSPRYPVLYLLHGMNADDAQWERLGVPQAADTLIDSGQARPFIVVMPQEDPSALDPDVSPFDDWLVNILVPWMDANYPTCAERACRAIGGLSRGSGWAFRIGLTDWQVFGAIGMHSFSPFPGDLQAMDGWMQAFSAAQRPRLYIDVGIYDQAVPDAQQFEQKLTDLRFAHEWHLNDGAHNEDYWREHVIDYLRWYTEGWQ